MQNTKFLPADQFEELLRRLPVALDLDSLARQTEAIERRCAFDSLAGTCMGILVSSGFWRDWLPLSAETDRFVFFSIAAVAAGRFDVGEVIKIEAGNSFERLRSSAAAQAVG